MQDAPHPPSSPVWFDAHLDLAYLAVNKRDMLAPLSILNSGAGEGCKVHPPAAVSLPALADGGVRFALATIFTESVATRAECDAPEKYVGLTDGALARTDAEAIADAHRAGRAQLEVYLSWQEQGLAAIDLRKLFRQAPGTGEVRGGMGVAEPVAPDPLRLAERVVRVGLDTPSQREGEGGGRHSQPSRTQGHTARVSAISVQSAVPIHLGILMENADPIREPGELSWWRDRGLVAVGMSWSRPSRYAGGNATTQGLTPMGRELVREMDRLGLLHDVSHLSERSFDDLLDATDRPVMASHSNCRALLASTAEQRRALTAQSSGVPLEVLVQRHLTDDQIRRILERGGVIGLNLFKRFIATGLFAGQRPSVARAIAHVRHICDIAASVPSVVDPRRHVALGSDMDGGLSAHELPEGINSPSDLGLLLEALAAEGWNEAALFDFTCGNWVRLLNRVL